ncbi:MAG: hypothetical protein P8080_07365 [Gammaproteobacteria bacterium]
MTRTRQEGSSPSERRGRRVTAVGLGLLLLMTVIVSGCGIIERATGQAARRQQMEIEQKQLSESVQLAVMRFSDQYRETIETEAETLVRRYPDVASRIRLLDWSFSQATAATIIAAGPNIVTNVLDMVVLAGLSRRVAEESLPARWPRGEVDRVIRVHRQLENEAFRLLQLLDPGQEETREAELSALMDQWSADNPDVTQVAYIRFADFAGLGKRTQRPVSPGLLGIIGLDLMSGIDPAVAEIEQTRQLAERALFYAQRLPMLIDLQIRVGAARVAAAPEMVEMLQTVNSIGAMSRTATELGSEIPGLVARERQAAIDQVLAGLQAQQAEMTTLARELRGALEAGALTAENLDGVVNSADRLMARFEPAPGAAPKEPGRPFDITEYTTALAELNVTTRELQALLAGVDGLAPRLAAQVDELTARTEALVDYAFWRLVLLIAVILLAAIVYRLVARSVRRPAD